jgi:hypothetical protein
MTRMKTIAALGCTALAAAFVAYGCGSSSTIDNGSGGGSSGTGGKTGAGTGGGVVIITNVGGMTGTAGMNGGVGGMTAGGMGGRVMPPPMDAGPAVCAPNNQCTAPSMCDGTCNRNGQAGTRTCMCGNNGRYTCGVCMVADAGAPPPPMDAGPRPDAGTPCAGNVANNRQCMLGVSMTCVRNVGGGNMQTCMCEGVQDAGADAAVTARWVCM